MIFTSYDKKEIYVREWTKVKDPCGVIQLAHGMNEYTGRYEAFASYFNGLGYIVVGDDHRGHGETDAETLGYAEGEMFSDTVKDMAGIAKFYREKYEGLKYVLFGFSYGSFLTQAFIRKYARFLDGAVIAGSSRQNALAVRAGLVVSGVGSAFKGKDAPANFVNRLVFGGYDKKFGEGDWQWLSSDRENNEKYRADPFCNFVCSNAFFRSFFRRFFCGFLSDLFGRFLRGFFCRLFCRCGRGFGLGIRLVDGLPVELHVAFARLFGARLQHEGILFGVNFHHYAAHAAYGLYLVAGLDGIYELFCLLLPLFVPFGRNYKENNDYGDEYRKYDPRHPAAAARRRIAAFSQ